MSNPNSLEVKILEKEYLVACPPEKKNGLREAASMLDQKMREIRASGKVHGSERIAVMAALNFTYDLLEANSSQSTDSQVLNQLEQRMDQTLARF